MAIEIERKFLVNSLWRDVVPKDIEDIVQGYLPTKGGTTARIRIVGRRGLVAAKLAIKGPSAGISRPEFEYDIPAKDAKEMIRLCGRRIVKKIRFIVPVRRLVWEIDMFKGRHDGLVVAEVELARPDQKFRLPKWVAKEVSGDPRYSNHSLAIHGLRLLKEAWQLVLDFRLIPVRMRAMDGRVKLSEAAIKALETE
jgi:adenylate cyclase